MASDLPDDNQIQQSQGLPDTRILTLNLLQVLARQSGERESGGRPRWFSSEIVRKEKFWWPSGSSSHLSQTQRTLEIKTLDQYENKIFVKMCPSLGCCVTLTCQLTLVLRFSTVTL